MKTRAYRSSFSATPWLIGGILLITVITLLLGIVPAGVCSRCAGLGHVCVECGNGVEDGSTHFGCVSEVFVRDIKPGYWDYPNANLRIPSRGERFLHWPGSRPCDECRDGTVSYLRKWIQRRATQAR